MRLERDQLATSLRNANQWLIDLEDEPHFVKIGKHTLVANTDLQPAETRKLEAEKKGLISVLSEDKRENAANRKRIKSSSIPA